MTKQKLITNQKIHEQPALSSCRAYFMVNYILSGCLVANRGVKMKFCYGIM